MTLKNQIQPILSRKQAYINPIIQHHIVSMFDSVLELALFNNQALYL